MKKIFMILNFLFQNNLTSTFDLNRCFFQCFLNLNKINLKIFKTFKSYFKFSNLLVGVNYWKYGGSIKSRDVTISIFHDQSQLNLRINIIGLAINLSYNVS